MISTLTAGLSLGLLLGMRHALEPDHLAAVSLLVLRKGPRHAPLTVGALWGLGHTLSLLAVSFLVAALGAKLPARMFAAFECGVAAMLLILGGRAVARSLRERGDLGHPLRHVDGHHQVGPSTGRRSLVVGLVHGLAGSGTLTAFVMASLPTVGTRLLYVALFGVGSLCGMACLTGLAGWPLARWADKGQSSSWLTVATGACSILLGSVWGYSAIAGLFAV